MSYDRLTSNNAALLLVDHQTGLSNGVQDQSVPEYTTSVTALVKLAKTFMLPTVITTSAADGPNGPILPIITQTLPDAPVIHRPGEINAWANQAFVDAVKKTGRKKLLVAGVSTEVCVAFVALSAKQAGFDVYAVIDASGTWNKLGRNPTGQQLGAIMGEHVPFYGNLSGSFMAAKGAGKKA